MTTPDTSRQEKEFDRLLGSFAKGRTRLMRLNHSIGVDGIMQTVYAGQVATREGVFEIQIASTRRAAVHEKASKPRKQFKLKEPKIKIPDFIKELQDL